MFLLSNENLSPNETDSGDVEIIRSTLVLSEEGLRVGLATNVGLSVDPKFRPSRVYKALVLFPACPLPEIPVQLMAAASEELRTGYPAEGRGMLAGCPG